MPKDLRINIQRVPRDTQRPLKAVHPIDEAHTSEKLQQRNRQQPNKNSATKLERVNIESELFSIANGVHPSFLPSVLRLIVIAIWAQTRSTLRVSAYAMLMLLIRFAIVTLILLPLSALRVRDSSMPPRLGKGIRQSLGIASSSASTAASNTDGDIADRMEEFAVKRFKRGQLSAQDMEEVRAIAGRPVSAQRNNAHRRVISQLRRGSSMPEPYEAEVDLWDSDSACKARYRVYFLLPYEMFDAMAAIPSAWTEFPNGSALSKTRAEWAARVNAGNPDDVVACGVWGDEAPFSRNDKLLMILWNPLSTLGERTRYWIVVVPGSLYCNCGCKGRCTHDSIWRVVSWSFQVWLSGRYPAIRHDGIPFSESTFRGDAQRARAATERRMLPRKGGVIQGRFDWDWLKKVIGLRGWQGDGATKQMCFRCAADKCGACPFTDASQHAKWRSTCKTHAQHLLDLLNRGEYWSIFWSLPGFQLQYIVLDVMHVCDLGITRYFNGNLCMEWFKQLGGLTTSPDPVLSEMVRFIKMASKNLGYPKPPLNRLTMGMMKPQKAKAPLLNLKASDSRLMVGVLHWIFVNLFPPETEFQRMRLHCLEALHNFYKELPRTKESDGDHASMATKLGKFARQHVALYCELSLHPQRPK
eukprot:4400873-Pyramimonas_sp.AAC.1